MKKILINSEPWQTRVAVLEEGRLRDLILENKERPALERSFIRGKIVRVLPGIQTAFVEIGQQRSGFLHVTELDRSIVSDAIEESPDSKESSGDEEKKTRRIPRSKLDISKMCKEGDEILVQVTKEPIFEKGAKLTTCFTMPGKFVVLMPNIKQFGISKKIEDRAERSRLREIVEDVIPEGMGGIVRTTAEGRSKKDIEDDMNYTLSEWKTLSKKYASAKVGEMVYRDISIALRAIREHLDDDTSEIICDEPGLSAEVKAFITRCMPEQAHKVKTFDQKTAIFDFYNIDKQISELLDRKVYLKSGGTIIIESTEAMTVVDVNTGRFVGKSNMEDTILKTNLEAAEEVVRQLRLRNIGGIIVIDFIDMMQAPNRQKLSTLLEKTLKEKDKLQSVALKVSEFGIVQMTRKRSGRTLSQQLTTDCPTCCTNGVVKSTATLSYELLRSLKADLYAQTHKRKILVKVPPALFHYLSTNTYTSLLALEKRFGLKIILEHSKEFDGSDYKLQQAS